MDNNKIIIIDWVLKIKIHDLNKYTYVYKLVSFNDEEKNIMKNINEVLYRGLFLDKGENGNIH